MSKTPLDEDSAYLLSIHKKRLIKRDVDQLLGICEFALLDGHIDQHEATAILAWLSSHAKCLDTWPANILYDRLQLMLEDDILDDNEQNELLQLVMSIASPRQATGAVVATTLPITQPAPRMIIPGRRFCFTGVFELGSRRRCHATITDRGGAVSDIVTRQLDYLVIGKVGSEFWRHTSFGAKIAKAVEYRDAGVELAIVSETHWRRHIDSP